VLASGVVRGEKAKKEPISQRMAEENEGSSRAKEVLDESGGRVVPA